MKTMVRELYEALRKAGVDEDMSMRAARAVLPADTSSDLATKADLSATKADLMVEIAGVRTEIAGVRTEMAEMKTDLIKWNVGAMAVLTAIFAAISRLG